MIDSDCSNFSDSLSDTVDDNYESLLAETVQSINQPIDGVYKNIDEKNTEDFIMIQNQRETESEQYFNKSFLNKQKLYTKEQKPEIKPQDLYYKHNVTYKTLITDNLINGNYQKPENPEKQQESEQSIKPEVIKENKPINKQSSNLFFNNIITIDNISYDLMIQKSLNSDTVQSISNIYDFDTLYFINTTNSDEISITFNDIIYVNHINKYENTIKETFSPIKISIINNTFFNNKEVNINKIFTNNVQIFIYILQFIKNINIKDYKTYDNDNVKHNEVLDLYINLIEYTISIYNSYNETEINKQLYNKIIISLLYRITIALNMKIDNNNTLINEIENHIKDI